VTRRPARDAPGPVALVLAAAGVALLVLPLVGLVWRAPFTRASELLATREATSALRLSLVCPLAATAVSVACGLPLAWILARLTFPGRGVVRALMTLPIVLPPVVGGVALLLAFGRRGLVGQWLDHLLGVRLPFTTAGAVLAEAFVAMPLFVITMEAAFRAVDRRLEETARTLGARRATVFRRVTLPLVWPGLIAGAVLCWARALGEFGATITFAGNVAGETQTLPLAVFLALETDPEQAFMLSLLLFAVSLAVLAAFGPRVLRPS
jgi:molybdate transport system permease protein